MIKVCLTHDVDRIRKSYQYLTKPYNALKVGNFPLFFKRLYATVTLKNAYWGFDIIIEIENKYQVKSTFFFLNESIKLDYRHPKQWPLALGRYQITEPKVREIIRYLDRNGWEIGVHGSFRSYKNLELLRQEKKDLEDVLGHAVIGIRQHHLNMNRWTWSYQREAGFLYDSSWGSNEESGFVDDRVDVFFPLEKSVFCEMPMTIMDVTFVDRKNKWEKLEKILARLEKEGGYLVVNFHTSSFDEFDYPCYKETYIRLIEFLGSKNARFMTMEQAYKEIMERE